MKLAGLIRKKDYTIKNTDQWNDLWDLWVGGKVASPYGELMTYTSEVLNGGHGQYFANLEHAGALQKELAALKTILPFKHRINLWLGQKAYRQGGKRESMVAELISMWCDFVFDLDEAVFNQRLDEYAAKEIQKL